MNGGCAVDVFFLFFSKEAACDCDKLCLATLGTADGTAVAVPALGVRLKLQADSRVHNHNILHKGANINLLFFFLSFNPTPTW